MHCSGVVGRGVGFGVSVRVFGCGGGVEGGGGGGGGWVGGGGGGGEGGGGALIPLQTV